MKVTLLKPPAAYDRSAFASGTSIPPIGLAYIASSLEKEGHGVSVVDALGEGIDTFHRYSQLNAVIRGLTPAEILSRIPPDTELLGVSCMFSTEWFLNDLIIRDVRRRFPRVPVVVGGEHATAEWNNLLLTCREVDYCVIGEGEETMAELVTCLAAGRSPNDVPGIAFRDGERVVRTEPRKRKKRLDELPWPAWDKFPVRNYHRSGSAFTTINRKAMPILASRGCPFSCSFCTSPQMWGTELYHRDPADVVREIAKYVRTYGVEHIDFCDIVGVLNPKWAKDLLTLLINENLGITWLHGAGTRSEILNEEMLDLFKKSNALRIFYAPETGSKKTIERIKKRVDLPKMMRSMRAANRRGISMRAPLIFGFPGQTMREVFESLLFGLKLTLIGVDDVVVHVFSAHPGTEFHRKLVDSGRIDMGAMIKAGKYHDFMRGQIVTRFTQQSSWSEHIPDWSLPFLQLGTMGLHYLLQFLTRPWKLVRSFRRVVLRRKPLTLFDHVLYRLLFGSRYRTKYAHLPEYALALKSAPAASELVVEAHLGAPSRRAELG